MRARLTFCAVALGALAGCIETAEPSGPAEPPPPSDACGASQHQRLVGQSSAILAGGALREARRIGPDMAVTSDYRPERMNIEYDANGIITKISCY